MMYKYCIQHKIAYKKIDQLPMNVNIILKFY